MFLDFYGTSPFRYGFPGGSGAFRNQSPETTSANRAYRGIASLKKAITPSFAYVA